MTREEIKELLPIIQAFAEGKQIQDKIEGLTDWVDTDEINLEYYGQKLKHRIKPGQKFDPKTLRPFDKVLVKDRDEWSCNFFSHIRKGSKSYPYVTIDVGNSCCIPYNDETKHLVGTTDEAPEYYRYWEE